MGTGIESWYFLLDRERIRGIGTESRYFLLDRERIGFISTKPMIID